VAYGSGLFVGNVLTSRQRSVSRLTLLHYLGEEFIDTITIGGSLTIPKQSIGDSLVALGNFDNMDGILG
jgi:hypothetical protein